MDFLLLLLLLASSALAGKLSGFFLLTGPGSARPALGWPGHTGLCLVTGLAAEVEEGHGEAVTGSHDPPWGAPWGCIAEDTAGFGGPSGAPPM